MTDGFPIAHVGRYWFVPRPAESHHWFGALFLFVGVLVIVEALAGGVWHRSRMRTLLWPGTFLFIGAGMLLVGVLDPSDRLIHFLVGGLILVGGWFEMRYRLGQIPRSTADLFVIPALVGAGIEVGVFHAHGALMSGLTSHAALGLTAILMAGLRIYQSKDESSSLRVAYMGVAVAALAFELWWDALFH